MVEIPGPFIVSAHKVDRLLEKHERRHIWQVVRKSRMVPERNGSNTRVYFVWSLMDLYELLSVRDTYGLYYVDFADKDMKRYPRSSAIWYTDFLKGTRNSRRPERFSRSLAVDVSV
ncbi:hypothetical protein BRADI_2g09211v3 [Brachypodium distachyon]|uniref:Uncharacterized protein n=1 Tax=Brachypodium distachyon TaxID=15368 RepID=A0A0Q3FW99_BRADI|nr:hypothetical protein BRADI_2g09211v3 [Brachypodium distachyon]